jgi:hypothetical protein
MTRVLRLEDDCQQGPYTHLIFWNYPGKRGWTPLPDEDGCPIDPDKINGKLWFGFKDIVQCSTWFPFSQIRWAYEKYNFHVSIYETHVVHHLKNQVLFNLLSSERVEILTLEKYLNMLEENTKIKMVA